MNRGSAYTRNTPARFRANKGIKYRLPPVRHSDARMPGQRQRITQNPVDSVKPFHTRQAENTEILDGDRPVIIVNEAKKEQEPVIIEVEEDEQEEQEEKEDERENTQPKLAQTPPGKKGIREIFSEMWNGIGNTYNRVRDGFIKARQEHS